MSPKTRHQHCRFSRQTAGWPVVRTLASMACQPCVFFCWATSRLCRLHLINSWQWNSSSYRWRFNFPDFLPLGLGKFVCWMSKWWWFRKFMSADSYPNSSLFWGGMDSWDLLYWDNFGEASGNLTKHFTRCTGVPKKFPSEPAWFSHNEFHTSFGFSQFRNPQQQKWASNQSWYGHVVTIGFLAEVDDDSPTW